MRIYVASSFLRKSDVRAMHAMLREAGHEITVDWTTDDATGLEGQDLHEYLRRSAENDIDGVMQAGAVVVLHDDRGRGMATELGVAIALNRIVIVVGGRVAQGEMKNVFYYLPRMLHVDQPEDVVPLLGTLERWVA